MNVLPGFTMLFFLHWLAANHPQIQSLEELSTDRLLRLADEFEGGGTFRRHRWRRREWERAFRIVQADSESGLTGYREARRFARSFRRLLSADFDTAWSERRDQLERYRSVPLHAVFLYTSEDAALGSYIAENWNALDRLSADFCDIHPSLSQLHGQEDAYSAIDAVSAITAVGSVRLSELPGIVFWDSWGRREYVCFRDWGWGDIRNALRVIFESIRANPVIVSVALAKVKVRALMNEQNTAGAGPVFNQNVYGGTGGQGMYVTQNVGIQAEQLAGLIQQLRGLAPHLPPAVQEEFLHDVEVLEDPSHDPEERLSAGQRIKAALSSGGSQVAGGAILAGLERLTGLITGG
ncbi:hypothetical protein [Streptomyces sp. NPDC055287]